MTIRIADLAPALHSLFTTEADDLARRTHFCRRARTVTGPAFARALVFTWMGRPSAPVEDLAAALDRPVTPQALAARLTAEAGDFLEALLRRAVSLALRPAREAIPLLRGFTGVYAEDMTDLGAGGGKALVRYELSGGAVAALEIHPAGTAEPVAARALPPPPPGSLWLADRGFFDAAALRRLSTARCHWLTRLPTAVTVEVAAGEGFVPLAAWLARRPAGPVDLPARVCASSPVTGRLVARPCPPAVAARRLARLRRTARRKGRPVGARQRTLCRWSLLFTDLPADRYGPAALETLYRCRWQVELLFKRWKSGGGVGRSRGRTPARRRCEVLAKLLAAVVAGWAALTGGGPLAPTSPTTRERRVRGAAVRLAGAVTAWASLVVVLTELAESFRRLTRRVRRRSPSTRQLLFRPRLAA